MPEHAMIGKVGCAAMLLTTCMSPLSRCTSAALSLSKMKSEPQSLRAGRHPRSKAFLRSVSPMGFCVLHVACCSVACHRLDPHRGFERKCRTHTRERRRSGEPHREATVTARATGQCGCTAIAAGLQGGASRTLRASRRNTPAGAHVLVVVEEAALLRKRLLVPGTKPHGRRPVPCGPGGVHISSICVRGGRAADLWPLYVFVGLKQMPCLCI